MSDTDPTTTDLDWLTEPLTAMLEEGATADLLPDGMTIEDVEGVDRHAHLPDPPEVDTEAEAERSAR